MAEKTDLVRRDRALYSAPRGRFVEVEVPALRFLAIEGAGSPDGADYADAIAGLYALAYPVKFASKAAGRDYAVPPLEGLWWADDPAAFRGARRDEWRWRMLLRLPEWVTGPEVEAQRDRALAKASAAARVEVVELTEGRCLQTLHVGPFADEASTLARLHDEVMPEGGLTFAGPHHEVYFSDPRRADPERMRTLLRQPVRPLA